MKLYEQDFYDYKTAPVNGSDVVDKHRTGMSFYDDFISGNKETIEYLKREKNLVGEVVMMSPEEYFKACSESGFANNQVPVETLKKQRRADVNTLNHLKDVLTVAKKKFPMPMLNRADNGQEGLHRMMVIGDMFGWNHKVPVLVVDWADKQRAFEEAKRKRIEKIEYRIRRAVQDTLYYKFNNIDELREQLQWELDKQFDLDEEVSTPVQFELTSNEQNKEFTVTIGAATYSFDYEDVQFIDLPEEDDLDDVEFEVDDDFLVRYFGDDWRETYPHLKDKFNIKEEFESDINKVDNIILNHWGQNNPGEGCVFIHPSGKFINIYPTLDDHEDLCYWLEENYNIATPGDAEWFVQEFDYVRCRSSIGLTFIELPEKITSKQLYSLQTWMEEKVSSDKLEIETERGWKTYNLDDYFPEDLIKIIRRYYASGRLYENIK